jgi:chromosome partitioning protein
MRRAAAFRESYLMRIRRRDRDPAEATDSGEPVIVPYDYDQEGSHVPDPVTSVSADPNSAGGGGAEEAPVNEVTSSAPPPFSGEMASPIVSDAPAAPEAVPAESVHVAGVTPAGPVSVPAAASPTTAPAAVAPVVEPEPEPEMPPPPPAPASTGPKHAMRAPSIGDEATELLDGFKPVLRELPRIIAIANQKGGVGKTTTTVNLGAALAELDYRVLVIDLDPQGNATTGLGVEARNFELSMYDVIMRDQPLEDCIEPTSVKNLFVAPATIDLAGVEIELVPAFSRELKLKRAIATVVDDFDFVLIDCPPSLGLITVNGLAAADEVLVPIQCEYYALEGLSQLLRNVNLVSTNLNQTLEVSTIVLTMYDARTRLSVDVANEVREHFSERVCRAVIPRTVRLSEAPSFGQPITVFDPTSRGAVAYRELAKEVSNGAPQRSR